MNFSELKLANTSSNKSLNSKSSLKIYHQGAHVSSWISEGKEQLFLSKQSQFAQGKAIRGGVPVIFPQFAALGDGPRHGILRNSLWQLESQSDNRISFICRSSAASQNALKGEFRARFSAELGTKQLSMCLEIENTGSEAFDFAAALHTYFAVEDVRQIQVEGLKGSSFWDNGNDFQQRDTELNHQLRINSAIDRLYFDVSEDIKLIEAEQTRLIQSQGFSDVVVWNPWAEDCAALADMADDEYLNMLCIEAAAVDKPLKLAAGECWQGTQKISLL